MSACRKVCARAAMALALALRLAVRGRCLNRLFRLEQDLLKLGLEHDVSAQACKCKCGRVETRDADRGWCFSARSTLGRSITRSLLRRRVGRGAGGAARGGRSALARAGAAYWFLARVVVLGLGVVEGRCLVDLLAAFKRADVGDRRAELGVGDDGLDQWVLEEGLQVEVVDLPRGVLELGDARVHFRPGFVLEMFARPVLGRMIVQQDILLGVHELGHAGALVLDHFRAFGLGVVELEPPGSPGRDRTEQVHRRGRVRLGLSGRRGVARRGCCWRRHRVNCLAGSRARVLGSIERFQIIERFPNY